MSPNTSAAVMQQRREPKDSLDDFPTPPWATRALIEHLAKWGADGGWPKNGRRPFESQSVLEPACNRGHMAVALAEAFGKVDTADVKDYSRDPARAVMPPDARHPAAWRFEQDRVVDFLWPGWEEAFPRSAEPDWVITNPPFRLADQFARRAFQVAREGVALFVRSAFLEGGRRYAELFRQHPPEWILQFCERVVLHQGRLAPEGSTATAYCWLVWVAPFARAPGSFEHHPAFVWIPPCRKRLEQPGDYPAPQPGADPVDLGAGAGIKERTLL